MLTIIVLVLVPKFLSYLQSEIVCDNVVRYFFFKPQVKSDLAVAALKFVLIKAFVDRQMKVLIKREPRVVKKDDRTYTILYE